MIIKPKIEILTIPICLDPIPKNPILLDVNINSMFISDKGFVWSKNYKYFIGYKDDDYKINHYV